MGLTLDLAGTAVEIADDGAPPETLDRAKLAIRDVLGVALYGSQHPVGEHISAFVDAAEPGTAATLLGGGTASTTGAALANGTFGHAIDYDDTFESIVLHPTAPVFAAALATAERVLADGERLLGSYVAGVEVAYRIAHSVYPGHYDNGWHLTGTVGTFGATAAAGTLVELSPEALARAFGIAGSCSSSLKKNFGTTTKPLHAGHAAEMGIRAALLADEGFGATGEVLEGPMGYGTVMNPTGTFDADDLRESPEGHWGVEDIGLKPYPSGVITHAAMEATRRLVAEHDLDPSNVDRIEVTLDEAASEMLIHADPADELEAKFSIEFCLAAVLRESDAGVAEFADEYVTDPATREAMALVERAFEPGPFGEAFAGYGARVTVETTGGEEHVAEERRAPGSPSNPLTEERWLSKFHECATPVLDREAAERVASLTGELERLDDLGPLLAALGGPGDDRG
ncbi:MAG: MmgE/PrpD family protein [Haloarculaceae archaeon]